MKQISASSIVPRKSIVAIHSGVRRTNIKAAASILIFGSSTYLYYDITRKICRRVRSFECKQRTRLKQISVSYLAARKSIDAMLDCVRRTNSLAAASSLTFIAPTIAAIVRLYCKDKMVHSSECKRRTRFKQISATYLATRKSIDTMLDGVCRTNSLAAASSLIFTYVDDVMSTDDLRVECAPQSANDERAWNNFRPAA